MTIEELIIALLKYDKDCEIYVSVGDVVDDDYRSTTLKEVEYEEWDSTVTLKGSEYVEY